MSPHDLSARRFSIVQNSEKKSKTDNIQDQYYVAHISSIYECIVLLLAVNRSVSQCNRFRVYDMKNIQIYAGNLVQILSPKCQIQPCRAHRCIHKCEQFTSLLVPFLLNFHIFCDLICAAAAVAVAVVVVVCFISSFFFQQFLLSFLQPVRS